jgi:hypothetical protein
MSHTKANLTYTESEHEPNRFTIGANGEWLMAIQHNGEQMPETQRENVRRLVACWNACEGSSTKWLEFQNDPDRVEQFGEPEPFETRYTIALQTAVRVMDQRDQLLAALQAYLPFIPTTSAAEGGAAKYSSAVKAADMVRAAIAIATGGAA